MQSNIRYAGGILGNVEMKWKRLGYWEDKSVADGPQLLPSQRSPHNKMEASVKCVQTRGGQQEAECPTQAPSHNVSRFRGG